MLDAYLRMHNLNVKFIKILVTRTFLEAISWFTSAILELQILRDLEDLTFELKNVIFR